MLLVVLGAGASFDANPRRPAGIQDENRLPLTQDLFSDRFADIVRQFPGCHAAIPRLRPRSDSSIEDELRRLLDEAQSNRSRLTQIVAIQYYLQTLIRHCQVNWSAATGGVSNYLTLWHDIGPFASAANPVAIVTYNYDQLAELGLEGIGIKFSSLDTYVTDPVFRLHKVHGSINWAEEVELPSAIPEANDGAGANFVARLAPDLIRTGRYRICVSVPSALDGQTPLIPALAVPAAGKDGFVLPPEHDAALTKDLGSVTRIVVIGWRGVDDVLVRRLAENGAAQIPALIALGNEAEGRACAARFEAAGVRLTPEVYHNGFSELVRTRRVVEFLSSSGTETGST